MGRPRFLRPGLIALLLAACGVSEEDLLEPGDLGILSGGGGGGGYGPQTLDPAARGAISGRVVYRGKARQRYKLDITTADGFCIQANAPHGMMSEDFLVGANGELQGAIVYVKDGLSTQKWDVPAEPVVLDQKNCQYLPHVAVIQTGQDLIVKSSDDTNHNVHMARGPNGEVNRAMARPGQLEAMSFKKQEMARRIYCDVHGWMEAWLAILPHPFHAVTAADGTFTIANVPPGTYRLAAWHEELGEVLLDVTVKKNETLQAELLFEKK